MNISKFVVINALLVTQLFLNCSGSQQIISTSEGEQSSVRDTVLDNIPLNSNEIDDAALSSAENVTVIESHEDKKQEKSFEKKEAKESYSDDKSFITVDKTSQEGELTEQIKKLKINQVRLGVHSTKESYLPCQITLRCIKQALEEKFFGKDVAAARTTAEKEKEALEAAEKKQENVLLNISSQRGYNHTHSDKSSAIMSQEDPRDKYNDPIQYEFNSELRKVNLSDEDINDIEGQATAFINDIYYHNHGLDDSLNGSAAQLQVVILTNRLATVQEDVKKETEARQAAEEDVKKERAAKLEAEEKIRKKEEELEAIKAKFAELEAKFAAQQSTTASSS